MKDLNKMIEQLNKAVYFLECLKDLDNKLNDFNNKEEKEEECEE